MIYGITGTRRGATTAQKDWLNLHILGRDITEWHHGGCQGVDFELHALVISSWGDDRRPGLVVHPASGAAAKWMHPECLLEITGVTVLPAKPPLDRDHDIVDQVNEMLCLPGEFDERWRGSGTWATIRDARRKERPRIICYPDGTLGE